MCGRPSVCLHCLYIPDWRGGHRSTELRHKIKDDCPSQGTGLIPNPPVMSWDMTPCFSLECRE